MNNNQGMSSDAVYDVICAVRMARGPIAKQRVLRELSSQIILESSVQGVLVAGLHPHWHYGIKPTANQGALGDREWDARTWEILRQLREGLLSGSEAKRALRPEYMNLTYKSGRLLTCVLNKDFAFGLGPTSINKVWPGLIPVHAIQLAKPIDYARVRYPVYVSPKLDGLRAVYKNGKLYSRLGNEFKGLGAMLSHLRTMGDIELDGELMVPGEHFNEISGKLRSFNDTDNAVFNVFDRPDHPGDLSARYSALVGLRVTTELIQIVPHAMAFDADDIQDLYQDALSNGYEGIMVKDPNALYENARTWSWMKVKPTHTEDLKVIGTFEGSGKYEGLCGGLIVDRGGVRVRVGSGLSDAQRLHWADDSGDIVGSIIEVAFQEVTPDGSLRHPRLKTVRGDK